jgi:hypothetical protein
MGHSSKVFFREISWQQVVGIERTLHFLCRDKGQ